MAIQSYIDAAFARGLCGSGVLHALVLGLIWTLPAPEPLTADLSEWSPDAVVQARIEPPTVTVMATQDTTRADAATAPGDPPDAEPAATDLAEDVPTKDAPQHALPQKTPPKPAAAPEPSAPMHEDEDKAREVTTKTQHQQAHTDAPSPDTVTTEGESPKEVANAQAAPDERDHQTRASAPTDGSKDTPGTRAAPAQASAASSTRGGHPDGTTGGHGADLKKLRGGYLRMLVPAVSRHYYYPKIARRLGQEGRVLVALTINADGDVVDVALHKGCPHDVLNRGAVTALRRLERLPRPPPQLVASGSLRVVVPMTYSLHG